MSHSPSIRGWTYLSISPGSILPSASIITTMSPVAEAKPSRSAAPFPGRFWPTTTKPGHSLFATSTVRSVELPSTRMTSSTQRGID
jgi:hypothetical protein